MNHQSTVLFVFVCLVLTAITTPAQQNQRRNRGESFYQCQNSNTPGPKDIWLSMRGVGYIWDDPATSVSKRSWIKNIFAFPEVYSQFGITDFFSLHASTRVLSHGWVPGWFDGGIKLTLPNNQDLRPNGIGLSIDYRYQTREENPSLSGCIGFMPEGFVVKGHNLETVFIYELDLLPRWSFLPLRLLTNTGLRLPLSKRHDMYQLLLNIAVVYSGYGFDFFAQYQLESFDNLNPKNNPKKVYNVESDERSTFFVWFSENPMYITLGGDVRYDNGVTLSLAVPILLSYNQGSAKTEDQGELNRQEQNGIFTDEKAAGIFNPFDPWYPKWKIVASLSFPIRFKMSGAEMMRNYLLLKNRKQEKKIDIDKRLQLQEPAKPAEDNKEGDDAKRRLEEIKKKRETITK
ncbi:MAG: hypothetical protein JW913_11695 [Chitinispirillaceae bacterium]|nr:hypothetical protein [Chitinispirillaceae bacterium]